MPSRNERATTLDADALEAIRIFIQDHGYPPTRRELADLLGHSAPSTTQKRIESLVRRGMIRMTPGSPRSIVIASNKSETETL